jgi:hypothetical protein
LLLSLLAVVTTHEEMARSGAAWRLGGDNENGLGGRRLAVAAVAVGQRRLLQLLLRAAGCAECAPLRPTARV